MCYFPSFPPYLRNIYATIAPLLRHTCATLDSRNFRWLMQALIQLLHNVFRFPQLFPWSFLQQKSRSSRKRQFAWIVWIIHPDKRFTGVNLLQGRLLAHCLFERMLIRKLKSWGGNTKYVWINALRALIQELLIVQIFARQREIDVIFTQVLVGSVSLRRRYISRNLFRWDCIS